MLDGIETEIRDLTVSMLGEERTPDKFLALMTTVMETVNTLENRLNELDPPRDFAGMQGWMFPLLFSHTCRDTTRLRHFRIVSCSLCG